MKLYILLAIIVLFAFFSNDFGLVDIQKTAIILAAAIDKTENGYSLTAQIAVPKGSDRTTGGTSSVEIEAEGATVSDCVTRIYSKTGWVPKFVFCNLILLGEDAAEEDVMRSLNYFLRNEYMPDSCLLAVSKGKAGEMLSSQSALDDASSLVKSGKVLPTTLREFSIGCFGVSESSHLPFIRSATQKGEQSGAGGSGGGNTGEEEQKIYSAEETAIFSRGKMVALLPREQTFAYSLLLGKVFSGTFTAKDGEEPVTLTVLENKGGVSLKFEPAPVVKLSLNLLVRLCCRGTSAPIDDVVSDHVPDNVLENAESVLSGYISDLFATVKQSGSDLFFLKRTLYRSSLKKYALWKDSFLPSLRADITAEVKTKK